MEANLAEENYSKIRDLSRAGVWKFQSILCIGWFWVSVPDFHSSSSDNNNKKEKKEEKDLDIIQ